MAEAGKPAPDAGEVLAKVLAIRVTAADWHSMRGKPPFSRATLGQLVRTALPQELLGFVRGESIPFASHGDRLPRAWALHGRHHDGR